MPLFRAKPVDTLLAKVPKVAGHLAVNSSIHKSFLPITLQHNSKVGGQVVHTSESTENCPPRMDAGEKVPVFGHGSNQAGHISLQLCCKSFTPLCNESDT